MFFGKDITHHAIKADADIRKVAQNKVVFIQQLYNQDEAGKSIQIQTMNLKKQHRKNFLYR
ncbi:hypothetical protein WES_01131 [Escherichia sp. KTE31]|nr:hypothetical protein WEW_02102 [Escherichia coli KTE33]EOU83166.1 hypothetical protein WES_01131 [Escherichia sp. KTE31]